MGVGDPVEDFPALLASPDQPCQTELTKLMAGSRLADIDQMSKIAHAQFATVDQGINHPETCRVGQQLEPLGQQLRIIQIEDVGGRRPMTMRGDDSGFRGRKASCMNI